MKTIKIIAREEIISPSGKLHNDEGLKALNGYVEETVTVDDEKDFSDIGEEFIKKHNLSAFWNISFEEVSE